MYKLLCSIFLLFVICKAESQETVYKEVLVKLDAPSAVQSLADQGFDIDHYRGDWKNGIRFYVDNRDVERLALSEFDYQILVENYSEDYLKRFQKDLLDKPNPNRGKSVADGFGFGSLGGFYTYIEMIDKLDEMHDLYPDLISPKISIGETLEGRQIWSVKISDNPEMDEDETVAYFDAMHHAREPLSMATCINYMFWLLENYETNPQVNYLINNREIYFVPIVNPDGYVYNELSNPNGGGLWRKNRNPNSGGCFGVDLNRNYSFGYAATTSCSSVDPCSQVFRGDGAFSELEAIAVRNFIESIKPRTAFSTHSTAGSYLMPYGYNSSPPAFDIYSEWASDFLSENDYPYGTTSQMLGYTSCGTTRDYLHSEDIYAWTPEIDGSGFWPLQSEIFDLVDENVYPFFYQSWIAGAYVDVQSHSLGASILAGNTSDLYIEIKNRGIGSIAKDVSVVVEPLVSGVSIRENVSYGDIPIRERMINNDPILVSVDSFYSNPTIELSVQVYQEGVLNGEKVINLPIGIRKVIFADDAENGLNNWLTFGDGQSWEIIEDDAYGGTFSIGDSDNGNGDNEEANDIELNVPIDLSKSKNPYMSFARKFSIEEDDMVQLWLSSNGGSTWQEIARYSGNEHWKCELISLEEYKNSDDFIVRFSLKNDRSIPGDGFYFDDFEIVDMLPGVTDVKDLVSDEMNLYPNPFKDHIKIEASTSKSLKYAQLFDANGRWTPVNLDQKSHTITIQVNERLPSGVYFVQVVYEDGTSYLKKVIKQ